LQQQGDFVAYDAHEVGHSLTAISDCIVLVIRWPSSES